MKKDAGLMKSYVQEAFDTLLSVEDGALAGPGERRSRCLPARAMMSMRRSTMTASRKIGFSGGTIEGPTHFSQLAPLDKAIFGRWRDSDRCG